MKNILILWAINLFVLLILVSSLNAQSKVVGKLYTAEEANKLYGPVLHSVLLSVDEVKQILNTPEDYVMFKFVNNQLSVLDGSRKSLYGSYRGVSNDVYSMYSKSKVLELLKNGRSSTVYFEQRKEKFTITNGVVTLELAQDCPPDCY